MTPPFPASSRTPPPPGAVGGVVAAVVSFGLWPLVTWPARVRDAFVLQQDRLHARCQSYRLATPGLEADALCDDVARLSPRRWLGAVAVSCAAIVAIAFIASIEPGLQLYPATWGALRPASDATPQNRALFAVWTFGLTTGYLAHWLRVQLLAADVRRVVARHNAMAATHPSHAIQLPRVGIGLRPWWVLVGVGLACTGAVWAPSMALAAASHRRWARGVDGLALTGEDGSQAGAPLARRYDARCASGRCRAMLPAGARFCVRCGTRTGAAARGDPAGPPAVAERSSSVITAA